MRSLIWLLRLVALLFILVLGPLTVYWFGDLDLDTPWNEANWDSTGIAPDPIETTEAVVQVYAARVYHWRGAFATHSWISVKPRNGKNYRVYQLLGRRLRSSTCAISISDLKVPDFPWYNSKPILLAHHQGQIAEDMIPAIQAAAWSYPYGDRYEAWPGPNSNTFVAWIARAVPELRLDLPSTAIGKDYLPDNEFFASMPSGTGYQFSLKGLLGVGVALEEGIEFNLLGLSFGIDFNDFTLRLPGWGRQPSQEQMSSKP